MKNNELPNGSSPNTECHHCCGHHFWFWASIRILIVVGLIIGAFFLGSLCGKNQFHGDYETNYGHRAEIMQNRILTPSATRPSPSGNGKYGSMMGMNMGDMAKMLEGKTGDNLDRVFLEMMIPHHQGAVDMAKFLTGAQHPELQKMGQDIITAQNKEIEQMKKWQKEWGYNTGSTNSGNMHQGMMMH